MRQQESRWGKMVRSSVIFQMFRNGSSPEDKVSMNMWAAYPEFLEFLAEDFKTFLSEVEEGDLKKEYLLPNIVDKLIERRTVQTSKY